MCRLAFPTRGSGASRGLANVLDSGFNGPQWTGLELTRKLAKNIFFGLFDFLGVPILGGGSYPWRGFTLAFHGDSGGRGGV